MAGAEQSEVDTDVRITLFCDAEIVGGSKDNGDTWMRSKEITDYTDEDGEYVGEGSAAFEVIPNWFPTSATPEEQEFTECWAVENVQDNAVEVVSDCGSEESPGIEVAVGTGGSCTITNTVFFEGIPTLSQYGVVLMALIMLGVGFIGMRRYA